MNLVCVICTDLLSASDDVQFTQCGHMFHYHCLIQWLERSKSCPQCRNKCSLKNIHRVFFNIANLDKSNVDIASLQQELENTNLKNKEKDKLQEKLEEEIKNLKTTQKISVKTIGGLEKKLAQSNHAISTYVEQVKILKVDNQELDRRNKEIKDLKSQLNLLGTVQSVLTSTASDVDKILKEENNTKTLAAWVAALKRELKVCENKKNELRTTLKSTQQSLRAEQGKVKKLEEKNLRLESENYRMINIIDKFQGPQSVAIPSTSKYCCDIETPIQIGPQAKTRINITDTLNTPSPGITERVKLISESDSPYLNIKSSSIGLTPLLKRFRSTSSINELDVEQSDNASKPLARTTSDLSNKLSIFKKPRLLLKTTTVKNSNFAFNGLGTSERKDVFADFPKKSVADFTQKSTLSGRVKSGKLKKPASTNSENSILQYVVPD